MSGSDSQAVDTESSQAPGLIHPSKDSWCQRGSDSASFCFRSILHPVHIEI